jgi:hypothetical protein
MDMLIVHADSIDAIFVFLTGSDTVTIKSECPDPEKFKKKGIICLKLTSEALTFESIASQLVFFEMTKNV